MKKNISMNLGGTIFNVDEDAYITLEEYLDSIKLKFKDIEGYEDIVTDIEYRIAELFLESMPNKLITIADVKHVITIIGTSDDIDAEDEDEDEKPANPKKKKNSERKLFRDPEDKVIAGVCGGLGKYFGINATWIRLGFAVCIFMTLPFIIYAILWIAIPYAKNRSEKMAMEGESINLKNIEKKINENINSDNTRKVIDKIGEVFKSIFDSIKPIIQSIFKVIGNVFGALFKIVSKLFGICLILAGACLLVMLSVLITGLVGPWGVQHAFIFGYGSLADILGMVFHTPILITMSTIVVTAFILIPIILIIYWGLQIILNFKMRSRYILIPSVILWFILAISIIHLSLIGCKNYSEEASNTVNEKFDTDTLYIRYSNDNELISDTKLLPKEIRKVHLLIEGIKGDDIILKLKQSAYGKDMFSAEHNLPTIPYQLSGDTLIIDSYSCDTEFNFQQSDCQIGVPIGANIVILNEEQLDVSTYPIRTFTNHIWNRHEKGVVWIRKEK